MTYLIVDDNPQMRRLIGNLLLDLGQGLYECSDGSQVLDVYRTSRPDWVLMDIKMGAVDGIQATRSIRSEFPDARIVIVTDYDDPHLREAASRAGACGYFHKENLIELKRFLVAKKAASAKVT